MLNVLMQEGKTTVIVQDLLTSSGNDTELAQGMTADS